MKNKSLVERLIDKQQEMERIRKEMIRLCDMCGEPFKGPSFPVVDENYKVQKGIIQCVDCSNNIKKAK